MYEKNYCVCMKRIIAKFNELKITEYIWGVPIMVLISNLNMSFVRILSFGLKKGVEVTTRSPYIQNDPYFTDIWNNLKKSRKCIKMFWITFYLFRYCRKDNEEYLSSTNKYI